MHIPATSGTIVFPPSTDSTTTSPDALRPCITPYTHLGQHLLSVHPRPHCNLDNLFKRVVGISYRGLSLVHAKPGSPAMGKAISRRYPFLSAHTAHSKCGQHSRISPMTRARACNGPPQLERKTSWRTTFVMSTELVSQRVSP